MATLPDVMRPPTRNDVARRAGTSTAVVSYVVNGGPRPVSAQTRARVESAIAELGYQPNLVARALRANRSNMIGMVVPNSSEAFFSELVHGVERAAYAQGSLVLLGNAGFSTAYERRYLESLANMHVDGVLLVRSEVGGSRAPILGGGRVPVVYLSHRAPRSAQATSVVLANAAGGALLTGHLIEHGYRRIGCLTGTAQTGPVAERTRGWVRAVRASGRNADAVLRTPLDRHLARQQVTEWLSGPDRPDAIFATGDGLALDVIGAAHELGLRVPDELAVVGFGGTTPAAHSWPTLTTAGHSFDELGTAAVETLSHVRAHGRQPDVELDVELIRRRSCGCSPGSTREGAPGSAMPPDRTATHC